MMHIRACVRATLVFALVHIQALTRTHTSVGQDELTQYTEWTEEFGEEGA